MLALLIYMVVPAVLTLAWFFYRIWPKHSVRVLRDELFAIRDELFEFAKGNPDLEFEDVAYGMLRSNINGYIRFADSISLYTFENISRVPVPDGYVPWGARWKTHLDECSPAVRSKLEAFHRRALSAVFRHALNTSLVAHCVIGLKKLQDRFSVPVESAGEVYGESRSTIRPAAA